MIVIFSLWYYNILIIRKQPQNWQKSLLREEICRFIAERIKKMTLSSTAIPEPVAHILSVLTENGYQAYLVGGCVRDSLLGRRPNDWDLCTSALPEQTQALFEKTVPTGLRHGTVTVLYGGTQAEVTTFRCDGDYTDHRRPDSVRFGSSLTEDLARRDFTVNAMAMDRNGILYDPFGGQTDLAARIVRCVGSADRRFREDALRMLRCLRFSAQLDFSIHPETWSAVAENASLCRFLAPERIRGELEKTLLSPRPERLGVMVDLGLLDHILTTRQPVDLADISQLPADISLRWARLTMALYTAGAIAGPEQFLKRLRLDSHTIRVCSKGAALAREGFPDTVIGVKRLLARYDADTVRCGAACGTFSTALPLVEAVLASGECYGLRQLAVDGRVLMEQGLSGPEVGHTLWSLLDWVIRHPDQNQRDILLDHLQGEKRNDG